MDLIRTFFEVEGQGGADEIRKPYISAFGRTHGGAVACANKPHRRLPAVRRRDRHKTDRGAALQPRIERRNCVIEIIADKDRSIRPTRQ
jgi:hypothetical protein